jgi:hypothetical protein
VLGVSSSSLRVQQLSKQDQLAATQQQQQQQRQPIRWFKIIDLYN